LLFSVYVAGQGNFLGELNWHCDPEAAHAVLAGLNKVITLMSQEVCFETALSWVCDICSAVQQRTV